MRRGIVFNVMRMGKRIGQVELHRVHRMPDALRISFSRRDPPAPVLQVCQRGLTATQHTDRL